MKENEILWIFVLHVVLKKKKVSFAFFLLLFFTGISIQIISRPRGYNVSGHIFERAQN